MTEIVVRPVTCRREKLDFLGLPWAIYRDDPNWVPPLRGDQAERAGFRAHPFYEQTNQILDSHGFDAFVEGLCQKFYADKLGRPSLPPAVYFRLLLIGYFEGIDSEGALPGGWPIRWVCGGSWAIRSPTPRRTTRPSAAIAG